VEGAAATATHPTIEHLFFRHRGVIDVTAASDGEASWGDRKEGGLFTRTLGRELVRPVAQLDVDRDRRVSWKEFFPRLRRETEGTFRSWSAAMRGTGESIDQPTQKPAAFDLGEPVADAPEPGPASVHAVICLANESGEGVRYRYRWTGEKEWRTAAMDSGKRGEHSTPLAKGPDGVRFEILFEGNKSAIELEPDTWTGSGAPPKRAAGREYPILLRKKD
jgi:hypothetical protein